MAFHIDYTAVDIDGYGFKFLLAQQLSKDLEIDLSQHMGCFKTEVPQKSRYSFRLLDQYRKFIDQSIALEKFQAFQFVNSDEITSKHGFNVIHLNLIGRCIVKHHIVINQVKKTILVGMFEQ